MRASTLTAIAALSADQETHHHRFILGHQRLQNHDIHHHHPSINTLNTNTNTLLSSHHRQMTLIGLRGGGIDAGGSRVGVSFDEALIDNNKLSPSVAANHPSAAAVTVRGGDKSNTSSSDSSSNDNVVSILGISLKPQALATLSMATCMSLHYLAYSLARPATMTLFTSSRLGFGNSVSAYPFAMTFISPMSFVLLLYYGQVLNKHGPTLALKKTTLGCASILGLCALCLAKLDPLVDGANPTIATITKYIVGILFIFRESYVQLITSQHWSFISSVLTPNQSSRWFAPISGLTSVTSALAAMGVGKLSSIWGLQGVLGVAAVVLGGSVIFGEMAYSIAEKVSCFVY